MADKENFPRSTEPLRDETNCSASRSRIPRPLSSQNTASRKGAADQPSKALHSMQVKQYQEPSPAERSTRPRKQPLASSNSRTPRTSPRTEPPASKPPLAKSGISPRTTPPLGATKAQQTRPIGMPRTTPPLPVSKAPVPKPSSEASHQARSTRQLTTAGPSNRDISSAQTSGLRAASTGSRQLSAATPATPASTRGIKTPAASSGIHAATRGGAWSGGMPPSVYKASGSAKLQKSRGSLKPPLSASPTSAPSTGKPGAARLHPHPPGALGRSPSPSPAQPLFATPNRPLARPQPQLVSPPLSTGSPNSAQAADWLVAPHELTPLHTPMPLQMPDSASPAARPTITSPSEGKASSPELSGAAGGLAGLQEEEDQWLSVRASVALQDLEAAQTASLYSRHQLLHPTSPPALATENAVETAEAASGLEGSAEVGSPPCGSAMHSSSDPLMPVWSQEEPRGIISSRPSSSGQDSRSEPRLASPELVASFEHWRALGIPGGPQAPTPSRVGASFPVDFSSESSGSGCVSPSKDAPAGGFAAVSVGVTLAPRAAERAGLGGLLLLQESDEPDFLLAPQAGQSPRLRGMPPAGSGRGVLDLGEGVRESCGSWLSAGL